MNSTILTSVNKKKIAVVAAAVAGMSLLAVPVRALILPETTEVTPSVSQEDGDERSGLNGRVLTTDEGDNAAASANAFSVDGDESSRAGANASSSDDDDAVNAGARLNNRDGDESQHAGVDISSDDDSDSTTVDVDAGSHDGDESIDLNLGLNIQD